MENSDSQPKLHGTKKKSLSKQIDFFSLFKQYQKSESEDPLAFPKSSGEYCSHWHFHYCFFFSQNTWKQNKMYMYQIELGTQAKTNQQQ